MLRNLRCCVGRAAVTLALLVSAGAFLHAQSAPGTDAKLQTLPGNPPPQARSLIDRGRAPDTLPMDHILLMLRRSAFRAQALNTFVSQQYDPHSANFHHWLTPEQFDQQFGPSSGDVAKVTQWLSQQGFTINRVPAGGLFVDFSGNAGQVAHAFHTEIHRYRIGQEDHYANATDPSIPADLSPIIAGFRALNDLHPQSQVHHLGVAHYDRSTGTWARANAQHPLLTNPPGTTFPLYIAGPQDFATIYGVDQVWRQHATADPSSPLLVGTGQTIAVVGETNLQSADIQNFRDQFGLTALGPNGSVQMENPPASVCAAPNPSANEPESYLDAEWAGATAPDATIDFVACGRQGVTSGADLAAAYIIADPVHVQKISVLSTSYGGCEAQPQSEANQFYVSLWQQAAVEGITVVVASGDAGGDGCGGVYTASSNGLSVVNEASTPWNIAAGGTDFSDVFSGTAATYWSPTNGANLQSARSYIPEMAWNDTCASPLVLAKFGATFSSAAGPNGYCTYASQQPIDQNTGFPPYFFAFAGGGGLSTVSPRPDWQAGVAGLPAQGGRAVPDISMFSAGGDTWSQTLILCDSALVNMPAGSGCDFTNANDVFAGYGGGTSFAAPAFAGIMALIDQKSGDRQGQANYVLYPLGGRAVCQQQRSHPAQPGHLRRVSRRPGLERLLLSRHQCDPQSRRLCHPAFPYREHGHTLHGHRRRPGYVYRYQHRSQFQCTQLLRIRNHGRAKRRIAHHHPRLLRRVGDRGQCVFCGLYRWPRLRSGYWPGQPKRAGTRQRSPMVGPGHHHHDPGPGQGRYRLRPDPHRVGKTDPLYLEHHLRQPASRVNAGAGDRGYYRNPYRGWDLNLYRAGGRS